MMRSKVFGAVASLSVAVVADAPAHAEFMSSYPAVIVIPPPAQYLVMPKPAPKPQAEHIRAAVCCAAARPEPVLSRQDEGLPIGRSARGF